MIAVEISHFTRPVKTIIISSAVHYRQVPYYFRILKWLPLHRVVPAYLLKHPTRLAYWLFGIKTEKEKKLFDRILQDTDVAFLRWAIHAILTWKNKKVPENLVQIHGTDDSILPLRFVKPHYVVKGGRHFMVFSRAREVSDILKQVLIPF